MIVRTAWIIAIALIAVFPTMAYAQVFINYINVNIHSGSNVFITQLINITSNQLVIPIDQYCSGSNVEFTAYLDPLSNLGITSVNLILYNGTYITVPASYSPKYVSIDINCSLPIYGIYLRLGNYPPYPLEALIVPGSNMTYVLTHGSLNITVPAIPGLNYLFSLVRVISISPATASVSNYLTMPMDITYSSINIGSINTYAEIVDYITYSDNIQITANGTTYVVVTPYYYMPMNNPQSLILPTAYQPVIMLTGAPWINYLINNCTTVNMRLPKITPWTKYLLYSPQCSVNMVVNPITVRFTDRSLQELQCSNAFLIIQNGTTINLVNNVSVNPISNRRLYLVIGGVGSIPIILNSIPISTITIQVPLITRQDIRVNDLLGDPVDAVLYLNSNGTLLLFTNNTCIYPGNYDVYALINGQLMNLGVWGLEPGSSLTIPVFSNYTINAVLPQGCPGLGLELVVKYGDREYVAPLVGDSARVVIEDAVAGSRVNLELLGNRTLLYQYALFIRNGSSNEVTVELSPHVINFVPMDLLGNELPTASLNIGGLHYVGPGRYCVPTNSSVGMVIYGNEIYIVNVTGNNLYVRVWALGPLSIKSFLTALILLMLLFLVVGILRKLGGGGKDSDKYVIIR